MSRLVHVLAVTLLLTLPALAQPRAYVSNAEDASVSVIDTSTGATITTVAVSSFPYDVHVAPGGQRVYVTSDSGPIDVIDAATNTVIDTIPTAGARRMAIHPDGSTGYLLIEGSDAVIVLDLDSTAVTNTISVGDAPAAVAVLPDGSKFYVANFFDDNVSVIDTATETVLTTVAVGSMPLAMAASPDSSEVYVGAFDGSLSVISTTTDTVVDSTTGLSVPKDAVVTPDGSTLYVCGEDRVTVIDTASVSVVTDVDVGAGSSSSGIDALPDGSQVLVVIADGPNDDMLGVIDTASNTLVDFFTTGDAPAGVAVRDSFIFADGFESGDTSAWSTVVQ